MRSSAVTPGRTCSPSSPLKNCFRGESPRFQDQCFRRNAVVLAHTSSFDGCAGRRKLGLSAGMSFSTDCFHEKAREVKAPTWRGPFLWVSNLAFRFLGSWVEFRSGVERSSVRVLPFAVVVGRSWARCMLGSVQSRCCNLVGDLATIGSSSGRAVRRSHLDWAFEPLSHSARSSEA